MTKASEGANEKGKADRTLKGNNTPCPACALRRELQDTAPIIRDPIPCNVCDGIGLLRLADAEIVRRTVEEARRLYWPLVEARWRGAREQEAP